MQVAFADAYEPSAPFGAKGLGEIGLDAIPAASANAIADAVGVRIHHLPITAEKIHRALFIVSAVNRQRMYDDTRVKAGWRAIDDALVLVHACRRAESQKH